MRFTLVIEAHRGAGFGGGHTGLHPHIRRKARKDQVIVQTGGQHPRQHLPICPRRDDTGRLWPALRGDVAQRVLQLAQHTKHDRHAAPLIALGQITGRDTFGLAAEGDPLWQDTDQIALNLLDQRRARGCAQPDPLRLVRIKFTQGAF